MEARLILEPEFVAELIEKEIRGWLDFDRGIGPDELGQSFRNEPGE